ncbi:MAG: hypothetical protein A3C11_00015 [Candidatus Sungbacteria bacterium RIFCSPHIGHO2_02_FULL_49_12]|uniref:Glycosyltransferase 2-like domain-containing protein n=1 Tax=Candidatus Sungbacteria bacterium RIFCSPHIGHO2_02_FULL_49_12 TaxID=1802271 RepID=A0A1G2KRN4_9BACT|nr:MAG: hypothetical protein A3C11_00015 [Candidatus Sungbacteria bacterium RIFCSPHIGHO2_02_FULL_49_12]
MKYSVLVIASSAENLSQALEAILNQTVSPDDYEIYVVSDGLNKNIESVAAEYKNKYPARFIQHIRARTTTPALIRNAGVKEARGEIIFFTNDDYIVPANWMEELLDGYRRYPDVAGVGGWHDINQRSGYFQRCTDAMDKRFGRGILDTEVKSDLYIFYPYPYIGAHLGNLSYKKSALNEFGSFDENMRSLRWTAEELNMRMLTPGRSFLHLPAKVQSIRRTSIKDSLYEHVNEGKDLYYLHLQRPQLISDINRGFLYVSLRLLAHAEISSFYIGYLLSTLARAWGRFLAKYRGRFTATETNLLLPKTFEILKRSGSKVNSVKTSITPYEKYLSPEKDKSEEFYSIVIPTYNRSEAIMGALKGAANQTIPPDRYEIIVIDDGSTDNTKEKILEFARRQPRHTIRYFHQQNSGPAKARNLGIKEARGEVIFFTDDDSRVPPDWIRTLLDGFRRYPRAAGVGGWIVPPEGETTKSATSRYLHFASFFSHPIVGSFIRSHEIISDDPLMFFGTFAYNTANICYKKNVLQKVSGFREDFRWPGSEDNDLGFRIARAGFPIVYIPFHVTHSKAMNLTDFYKLHFRRGANGYLLRTINYSVLEELRPGFTRNYGSLASFVSRLNGPEKFWAFLEWSSMNTGIIYMKNKLTQN